MLSFFVVLPFLFISFAFLPSLWRNFQIDGRAHSACVGSVPKTLEARVSVSTRGKPPPMTVCNDAGFPPSPPLPRPWSPCLPPPPPPHPHPPGSVRDGCKLNLNSVGAIYDITCNSEQVWYIFTAIHLCFHSWL